jgi:hypothetical protein
MIIWPTKNHSIFLMIQATLQIVKPVNILEIGSGKSSRYFAEYAKEKKVKFRSVEENQEWVSRVNLDLEMSQLSTSHIIPVPIVDDWFEIHSMNEILNESSIWDFLMVDAPSGSGLGKRSSKEASKWLLKAVTSSSTIVIDDVHRRHNFEHLKELPRDFKEKDFLFFTYDVGNQLPNSIVVVSKNSKELKKVFKALNLEFVSGLRCGEELVHEI